MSNDEFPYLLYQERYSPLLKQIAWAAGELAGEGDVDGLGWFESYIVLLLNTARNRMNRDILDHKHGR